MAKRGPRFTKEEKLAIVKEGEKTGGKAIRKKFRKIILDIITAPE
jgi:hypothetical protein